MAKLILLVDDSATIQQLVALAFRDEKVEILSAHTARMAEELLDQQTPDLILADASLPDRDGFEFVVQLRTRTQTALTPIVMLVPASSRSDLERAMRSGADSVLTKPFDSISSLVETVNELASAPSRQLELVPQITADRDLGHFDSDDDSDSILELDLEPRTLILKHESPGDAFPFTPELIEAISNRIAVQLIEGLKQEVIERAVPEVVRIVLERVIEKPAREDSNVPSDIDEAQWNLDD